MKEINTKIERTYFIIPLLLLLVIAGCNKEPDYIPGLGIQGYRAPISKILFSPLAYDGATVAIEGFARDFAEEPVNGSDTSEDITTTFKLTDLKGNYIIILLPRQWEIVDNDYLIVGGIYRKNGNELEAQQFEIVDFEEKDEKGRDKEIEKRDDW
ncbi:MAG: hypothetical protein KAI07_09445 [Deltaproteobacteria bacterium]|nr:hypothetical protein [Deltaproteobacteria bacterium]